MDKYSKLKEILKRQILIKFENTGLEESNRKIRIVVSKGISFRNPILEESIKQSIIPNIGRRIPEEEKLKLKKLKEEGKEEDFKKEFREIVIDTVALQLKEKLESNDLPTPVCPTSVALKEKPNYYVSEPREVYNSDVKFHLFSKLSSSVCGKCGRCVYGLYIPRGEVKEILDGYITWDNDGRQYISLSSIVGKKIESKEVGPFEYVFYLLDKVFQEMFRKKEIPDYHVELFVVERTKAKKKFFSHYIIPNVGEVFSKLYYGDGKYTSWGISKMKSLILSFLVENWNIRNDLKKNNSEIAHVYINRLLYYVFCHGKLDMDAILFLEDLKLKLGDKTPVYYLEEVISWM
jgi:hypothetical protein